MRKKKKIIKIIFFTTLPILAIFLASYFFCKTPFVQNKIQSYVENTIKKNNLPIEIGKIKTSFLFSIQAENVQIKIDSQKIKIDEISFKISLLSLFSKTIFLSKVEVKNLFYIKENSDKYNNPSYINNLDTLENKNKNSEDPKNFSLPLQRPSSKDSSIKTLKINLPFNLKVKSFNIQNLHIENIEPFSLNGKLFLKKDLKNINLDIKLEKRKAFKDSYVRLTSYKKGFFQHTNLSIQTESLKFFKKDIFSKIFTKVINNNNFKDTTAIEEKSFDLLFKLDIMSRSKLNDLKEFVFSSPSYKKPILLKAKGKIFLKNAQNILIENLNLSSNIELYRDLSCKIENLLLKDKFIQISGDMLLKNFILKNMNLLINSKEISSIFKIPVEGRVNAKFLLDQENIKFSCLSPNLKIFKKILISNSQLEILGNFEKKEKFKFSGRINSNFLSLGEKFFLYSNISFTENVLSFSNTNLKSTSITSKGNFSIQNKKFITGDFLFSLQNLNLFKNFFPKLNIKGSSEAKISFKENKNMQNALLDINLNDFKINDIHGENCNLNLQTEDIFNKKNFLIKTTSKNIKFQTILINSLSFKIGKNKKNIFDLILSGKIENPFTINYNGTWNKEENAISINSENFSINTHSKNYKNLNPFEILLKKDFFEIKDFLVEHEESNLKIDAKLSKTSSNLKILANHFPTDFFPITFPILGKLNLDLEIIQIKNKLDGKIEASLENAKMITSQKTFVDVAGKIDATLKNENLKIKGFLNSEKEKLLNMDATIPIKIDFIPFKLQIIENENLKISFFLNGKIESLLEFIDLKNQYLKGDIKLQLSLENSILHPKIKGFCSLENALYENYNFGTVLSFNSKLLFDNNKIIIENFSGKDDLKGKFSLDGKIYLKENFPYNLSLNLENLSLLKTKYLQNNFTSGTLNIKGDKDEAFAKGELDIKKAEFTIDEKLPQKIYTLDIKFINKEQEKKKKKPVKKPYPINLDIFLKTSKEISVTGKGLNALLKGEFLLSGTTQNPISKGKFDLVHGRYTFSGKTFKLKNGYLVFLGEKGKPLPYLSVEAETQEKSITIIATLKGFLNNPSLTFTSSPPLPLNAIISYLLFGEDLSSLSGMQALQVATTIASLSDQRNILDSTKRSLGIDRLAVVSTKKDEDIENPDKIAVQVGKYITRGILVTFTQGTEEGTSNAGVEVDLGLGFYLELETLQEEEQTRVAIKWGHSF